MTWLEEAKARGEIAARGPHHRGGGFVLRVDVPKAYGLLDRAKKVAAMCCDLACHFEDKYTPGGFAAGREAATLLHDLEHQDGARDDKRGALGNR